MKVEECTPDLKKLLYTSGYHLYEKGQYEKAIHFFRLLTSYESEKPRNWKGLGACYQMKKEYEEAAYCYAMASGLDEKDPTYPFHAAECLWAQGKREKAFLALEDAKNRALNKKDSPFLARLAFIEKKWCNKAETTSK